MSCFDQEYARHEWQSWPYQAGEFRSLRSASPAIPCKHGVYLIRCPVPVARVCGASTVIYVGQSGGGVRGGQQGIGPGNGGPGRLFNRRGRDEQVRERIECLYRGQLFTLECSFVQDDPQGVETALLEAYFQDHGELPPANHACRDARG